MATLIEAQVEKWHRFVVEQDGQILDALLAEEVVFRSPFLWKPKEGKAVTIQYLSAAVRVFKNFEYLREFVQDNAAALEFKAQVGELTVKGIDLIQFDQDGQIIDFEVMIRPASGLQALGAAMAKQLAEANPS